MAQLGPTLVQPIPGFFDKPVATPPAPVAPGVATPPKTAPQTSVAPIPGFFDRAPVATPKTPTAPVGPVAPPKSGLRTATLPANLGGGAYTIDDSDHNKVINQGHTSYAGMPTKPGFQRNDIVPVSLGGQNTSKQNLEYEPQNEADYRDKVEKYVASEYKKGNLTLGAARSMALGWKNTDIPGQDAYDKRAGGPQSVSGNFIPAVKEGAVKFGTDIKEAYQAPVEGKEFYTSLKDQFNSAVDDVNKQADIFVDKHSSALEKGVAVGKTVLDDLNVLFSPFSAAIQGIHNDPRTKDGPADFVGQQFSKIFSAVGAGVSDTAETVLNATPIPDTAKDTLRPLVRDAAALFAQTELGKLSARGGVKVVKTLVKTMNDVVQAHPEIQKGFAKNPFAGGEEIPKPGEVTKPGEVAKPEVPGAEVAGAKELSPSEKLLRTSEENTRRVSEDAINGQREDRRLTNGSLELKLATHNRVLPEGATSETLVDVHRASTLPIRPGDHVTTEPGNAMRYADLRDAPVQTLKVKAGDLVKSAGLTSEFVFAPREIANDARPREIPGSRINEGRVLDEGPKVTTSPIPHGVIRGFFERPRKKIVSLTRDTLYKLFSKMQLDTVSPVARHLGKDVAAGPIRMIHTTDAELIEFDRNFKDLEDRFGKFKEPELRDFNMTRGTPQTEGGQHVAEDARGRLPETLKDPALTSAIREASDYIFKYASDHGIDLNYMTDYFLGTYKDPAKVNQFLNYWRSTERFTKEKVFPTPADAAAFGLELKNPNPITNLKTEMRMVAQRVGMKDLHDTLISSTGKPKVEFAKSLEDASMSQRSVMRPIEDPVFHGYIFDPEYANFVNTLISTNKVSQNTFLRGLRQTNIIAQQIKFFGSIFHLQNMVKASLSHDWGGPFNKQGFGDVIKSFKALDKTDPLYKEYTNLGGAHGYSVESQASKAMTRMLDKVGASWLTGKGKYVPVSPAFVNWMFEEFIPKLKFEKFSQDVAKQEAKLGRATTDAEKIEIIKRNQNYYGEMNERLFGRSGTATSALRLIFMAPGYGEGNFRVVGRVAKGDVHGINHVINTLVVSYLTATIGTYLLTGKTQDKPDSLASVRDLFKVKTNMKDGNGDTVYFDMMTFDKDYWSIYGNLATGQPGKIPGEIKNRLAGMFSSPAKALTDLSTIAEGGMIYDFKGDPIFYKTDPFNSKLSKFLLYEATQSMPISLSTGQQAGQKGVPVPVAVAEAVTGVRPTTSEKVKETKASQTDLYSLQDVKRNEQTILNKLYNENPDEALKQATAFNADQDNKLFEILRAQGVKSITKTEHDKYILTSLRKGAPKTGSTINP